jgi:phosphatidylglycerophosphate synthase
MDIVIDFRLEKSILNLLEKKIWGITPIERLNRMVERFENSQIWVIGNSDDLRLSRWLDLIPRAQILDPTHDLFWSVPKKQERQYPKRFSDAIYLPANLVCNRAWLKEFINGEEKKGIYLLVENELTFMSAKEMVKRDSFKTTREGLAKYHRILAWYFALPFLALRCSPNLISIISLLSGIAGGFFAWNGLFLDAAFFILLSCFLDNVDGYLARAQITDSPSGAVLDQWIDISFYVVVLTTSVVGLYTQYGSGFYFQLGLLGLLGAVIAYGVFELKRRANGFSSIDDFNKHALNLITNGNNKWFKFGVNLRAIFIRHTLPYVYLLFALIGRMDLLFFFFVLLMHAMWAGSLGILGYYEKSNLLAAPALEGNSGR